MSRQSWGGRRRRAVLAGVLSLLVASLAAPMVHAQTAPSSSPPSTFGCDQPAPDIDPSADPNAWRQRDLQNLQCATERQQDEAANPAFASKWAAENARSSGDTTGLLVDRASEPTRPHVSATQTSSAKIGDPFRVPDEWQAAGRGQVQRFTFVEGNGAHLVARIYSPNPQPHEGLLPAVEFSPGLQSYNEVNEWFAEGMAEAGYVVLIIDPQGQGDSENLPHNPDGSINCSSAGCDNSPTTDKPDTKAALDFLLATPTNPYPYTPDATGAYPANAAGTQHFNPLWARIDPGRVGIAGHSLGAIAVTPLGQSDPRVKAVVSFDNIDATYPTSLLPALHTPTLFFSVDYKFPSVLTPNDPANPPDPDLHVNAAYSQLKAAGVDTMIVNTRASTHYEFGYQPFPTSFQASRYGERVAIYYTRAWFDRFLGRGPTPATAAKRLTALTFDGSADESSIGSGTFDAANVSDAATPGAGNVPYTIAGKCVSTLLSFYYHSAYSLDGHSNGDLRRRGCP